MEEPVVITAAALVSSLGNSADETWDALLEGRSGIGPIAEFDASGFSCRNAAVVKGLGPAELSVHNRDARIMDRHAYMLLKTSRDAHKRAGLEDGAVPPEEIGYFGAMGMVDYRIEDLLPSVLKSLNGDGKIDYDSFYSGAFRDIHPLWPLSMLNNISFCQAAIDLDIKGENTVFCPHSDSAVHSIIEAVHVVLERNSVTALAGGVSEKVSPMSLARAAIFDILSESGRCRPFSPEHDGTVLGEGSGIIALELKSSAARREVPILGEIKGYGTSFGKEGATNSPSTTAIMLSMKNALLKAAFEPSDIDLVIAHGDGTVTGDKNELKAISEVFGNDMERLSVYSSKAALGHMLSGSAAVDAVIGTYILNNGIIPATAGNFSAEKNFEGIIVTGQPLKKDINTILINSLSYEGQCASLIIGRAD